MTEPRLLKRRRARRLSDDARAALLRAPVTDDAGMHHRTFAPGLDPVRVLLFGSGPLIGYGVQHREEAIDGPLARLLAEALGRGVTVESRVGLRVTPQTAVASLGGAGTATFSVAVWAAPFGEELTRAGSARAAVRAMLRGFREISTVPLVVVELPTPLGQDWRSILRRPRVERFNRMLRSESDRVDRVACVACVTYTPATAADTIRAPWHAALAARVAPAVVRMLGGPRPST